MEGKMENNMPDCIFWKNYFKGMVTSDFDNS